MSDGLDYEAYLKSKKIDSEVFRNAEPDLWQGWRRDFDQMHPNSFTVQKLNLINAIRRKYWLREPAESTPGTSSSAAPAAPPRPGKPVMRPRQKPDQNL